MLISTNLWFTITFSALIRAGTPGSNTIVIIFEVSGYLYRQYIYDAADKLAAAVYIK